MTSLNWILEAAKDEDCLRSVYRCYRLYSKSEFGNLMVCRDLYSAKELGTINVNFIKDFEDWFGKLCSKGETDDNDFQEFKTLVSSSVHDFILLDGHLSCSSFSWLQFGYKRVSVRSSDRVVLPMKKGPATTLSKVLGGVIDFIPGAGLGDNEIPVNVSNVPLNNVISFCHKKYKFSTIIKRTVQQLNNTGQQFNNTVQQLINTGQQLNNTLEFLKGIVNEYKAWLYGFVKSKKPLFSDLHEAADYLDIPSLFELTSMGVGDMQDKSVQEISDSYAQSSISSMLSPLGAQASDWYAGLPIFSMLSPLAAQAYSLLS